MPRNMTNGQYTPPVGTFGVSGSVIASTAYNAFVNDIGQEMTNSIAIQGETVMTASLNLGANTIINLAPGVASTDAANVGQLGLLTPIGAIFAYPSATAPSASYMLCNGAAISRSTYSSLFTLIGTTFGAGDGSTTFNIPNLTGRMVQGVGTASGGSGSFSPTLGQAAGNVNGTATLVTANLASHNHTLTDPTHTHGNAAHTHTAATSSHSHTISDPGHAHTYQEWGLSGGNPVNASATYLQGNTGAATGAATTGISVNAVGNIGVTVAANTITISAAATGITLAAAGSGTPFSIMPPYLGLYHVIRVI